MDESLYTSFGHILDHQDHGQATVSSRKLTTTAHSSFALPDHHTHRCDFTKIYLLPCLLAELGCLLELK